MPSWSWPDGDQVITGLKAVTVLAVATFAAIVSYGHIHQLALRHGETAAEARLLPLSVDGVIMAASLVMLSAARRHRPPRMLSRVMLAAGITATVAANVAEGLPPSWIGGTVNAVIGALLSAWPAGAFIGIVEMAITDVRDSRAARDGEGEGAVKPAAEPSPEAVTPPPPEKPARQRKPSPAPPAAPRRPAGGPRKAAAKSVSGGKPGASPADKKIAAALAADPLLDGATNAVIAAAAGVSESSVERYRRRLRNAGA